ncbi:MAG: hypothetical protein ILA07_07420 [Prevotella sp.]|nr:hypothetical protein [Prevotella sp.]
MKYLFSVFVCMMIMFFLMACTTDHSFKLDEKRQLIIVHNLLVLEIESESSQADEGHLFFIIKENRYDTKEFDTIRLQSQCTGLSIKRGDSSGYKKTQIINLLPNRKYTIIHSGMGGRVRIQEFFWTDSLGNLRVDPTRKRIVGYKDLRGA